MERRDLSREEKKICEKQIKNLGEELVHYEWLLEYNQLMVDKGLRMNYLAKVKEFKKIKGEIEMDLGITKGKIDSLKEQVEKGVEEKKTPVGVG